MFELGLDWIKGLRRWLSGKELPVSAGDAKDTGSMPGSGRSPREGNVNPLQYSCLKNSMDGGAWLATVHGGRKESDTAERLHYLLPLVT